MTKNTKNLIAIAAIGGVALLIYNQMNKQKSFANLVRTRTSLLSPRNINPSSCPCGECCTDGKCYVPVYDQNGNVSYSQRTCTGTKNTQIQQLALR
jgi:hypothetical protein